VFTGASETLRLSGIDADINTSGRYDVVKQRGLAMDRATQLDEIWRLMSTPDVIVGSVAALTETGSAKPSDSDRHTGAVYGQNDHPGQLLARGAHPPVAQRGEEAADDPHPVPPEETDRGDRGGHVQPHDEGQVGRLGPGHVQVRRPAAAGQRRRAARRGARVLDLHRL
jgi:hypothetical protein